MSAFDLDSGTNEGVWTENGTRHGGDANTKFGVGADETTETGGVGVD